MTVLETQATGSIMARLREQTSAQHKYAESRPLEQGLLRGTLPRTAYVEVLRQRLAIHRVLEPRVLTSCADFAFVAQLVEPRLLQEQNLRQDLLHFGVSPDSVEPLPAARRLIAEIERLAAQHPPALLGVYYVFEGSKNGARYVARSVRAAYGLAAGPGTLYLDPHGDEQRALWQQFKDQMDLAPFSAIDRDEIVAAAQLTFECVASLDDEILALAPA